MLTATLTAIHFTKIYINVKIGLLKISSLIILLGDIMKKILKIFLCAIFILTAAFCTVACNTNDAVDVYVVDGAPALSILSLTEKTEIAGRKVNIHIVPDIDALTGAIGNGSADVTVCPLNVSAKLYNGGVDFRLMSVNIFGVLHVVSKTSVTLEGLKGKTVYNIGKGGTPDVTFKYILAQNGIAYTENLDVPKLDKVNFKYVSKASDLIPLLNQGIAEFGVMGEPAVTQACNVANVSPVIDITGEWKKVCGSEYTQAGVTVKGELLSDKKFIKELYNVLSNNKQYALDNCSEIKTILKGKGSTLSIEFNENIVNNCNLGCSLACEIKSDIEKYLTALNTYNSASIGGKLPDSGFYIDYENL